MSNRFSLAAKCLVLSLLAVPAFTNTGLAQLPSFPGAEGAGSYTTGGRGTLATPTTVFEVTSLSDDGSVGTLRYALTHTATYRTVVFRVSGTIHLTSALKINKPNTTVAGQTAPGDGICLADYPVSVTADNVIVRYLRIRMGDKNQNGGMVNGSGDDDAFDGTYRKNVIIDHCTMSWSDDEAFTFYGGDSTTLQWNLISEPLNYSYHFETGDADFEHHGYGGIWGGRHASFHHNLLAHCQGRVPRFDGSRNLAPYTAGQENADFVNNVIYDWGIYNTNGGEGGNYNIRNNYYKYGPSTSTGTSSGVPVKYELLNPYNNSTLPYGKYYLAGNYVDGSTVITADNWRGAAMAGGGLVDTASAKVTTPFTVNPPLNMQSATAAFDTVMLVAGASLPSRDTLDQRIIQDVINRTGRIIDVQGGYPHGTAYALTVDAWPQLSSATAPVDSDHDGMPDTWELANGSNPTDATDRNAIAFNGYTKLENYLNNISPNGDYAPVFTAGATASLSVCQGTTATSINNLLAIADSDVSQTEVWTLVSAPLHGAAVVAFTATATGDTIIPSGLTFTPAAAYSGTDSFTVRVFDGVISDTIKIFVTILPSPVTGTITGPSALCMGSSVTLTDAASGGVWSSSNTAVATVTGGLVSGVSGGTALISYAVTNSCGTIAATKLVSVDVTATAGVVSGLSTVCVGSFISLTDPVGGGSWASSSPAATVSAGMVTGIAEAVVTISYTVTNSCGTATATKVVTVNPDLSGGIGAGTIIGADHVCTGSSIGLTNSVSGGIWSVVNTSASISSLGVVTAVSPGIDTVVYTITSSCGSSAATKAITVNTTPAPVTLSGASFVCVGASATLSGGVGGGTWSATNASATIADSVVHGSITGTDTIVYTISNICGTVSSAKSIDVISLPAAGVLSGGDSVCESATISIASTVGGGVWSSTGSAAIVYADGSVTGLSSGSVLVSYTTTNACGSATVSRSIIVRALPYAGIISGIDSICQGTITTLATTSGGGVWSTTDPSIALVSADGTIAGIAAGVDTVVYTVTNSCGIAASTKVVVVLPLSNCGELNTANVTNASAPMLTIYPNPNNGIFTLRLTSTYNEEMQVVVFNTLGEKMGTLSGSTNTPVIMRNVLAPGLYMLSARTAHEEHKLKFIVR